jgi:hypothetical protein
VGVARGTILEMTAGNLAFAAGGGGGKFENGAATLQFCEFNLNLTTDS